MVHMIFVIMILEGKVPFMNYYQVNICYLKINGYHCKQLNNSLTVFTYYAKFYAKWDFLKENVKTYKHLIHVEQDAFLW